MVFVSQDDLHRKSAPLFMRADQNFVWGVDLKGALKSVNDHFSELPETEREMGIRAFAHYPPTGNLVADLWDRFMRKGYRDEQPVKLDPEQEADLVRRLSEFRERPTLSGGELGHTGDGSEMMSIARMVRKSVAVGGNYQRTCLFRKWSPCLLSCRGAKIAERSRIFWLNAFDADDASVP